MSERKKQHRFKRGDRLNIIDRQGHMWPATVKRRNQGYRDSYGVCLDNSPGTVTNVTEGHVGITIRPAT